MSNASSSADSSQASEISVMDLLPSTNGNDISLPPCGMSSASKKACKKKMAERALVVPALAIEMPD